MLGDVAIFIEKASTCYALNKSHFFVGLTYPKYICLTSSTDMPSVSLSLLDIWPASSAMEIKPPVDVPTIMSKASVG